LAKGSVKEMPDSLGKRGVAILPNGDTLMAVLNVSPQTLGNLGETYSYVTNNYEIDSAGGGAVTPVSASDTNIQYIGMAAATDFSAAVLTDATKEKAKESMQMDTFQLKTNLLKDRLKLESDAAIAAAAAAVSAAPAPVISGTSAVSIPGSGSSSEEESGAQN
jgi:hypothetical protein